MVRTASPTVWCPLPEAGSRGAAGTRTPARAPMGRERRGCVRRTQRRDHERHTLPPRENPCPTRAQKGSQSERRRISHDARSLPQAGPAEVATEPPAAPDRRRRHARPPEADWKPKRCSRPDRCLLARGPSISPPRRRRPRARSANRARPCASPYDASMSMAAGTFMTPNAQQARRPCEEDGFWDGGEPAFDRAHTPSRSTPHPMAKRGHSRPEL